MQPNMLNVNEMDYDWWSEWDRLWVERNKVKNEQSADKRKWDKKWTMKSIM